MTREDQEIEAATAGATDVAGAGCAAPSGSVVTADDIAKCVANVPHNWGKWAVTQKLVCTNWGTVSIIQERRCSVCGLTQTKRQTI